MKDLILLALKYAKQIKYHEGALFTNPKDPGLAEAKKHVEALRLKTRHLSPRNAANEILKAQAGDCLEHSILVMDFFAKLKEKFPKSSWTAALARIQLLKKIPGEMIDHAVVILKEKSDQYWAIDGQFGEYYHAIDLSQLKAPVLWYTSFTQGYELQKFDHKKHYFEICLTLEGFLNDAPLKPLPVSPFHSLYEFGSKPDETHSLIQSKL